MILPIPIRSEFFDFSAAAPTALQPGEEWAVHLELTARRKITLAQLRWIIPEELSLRQVSGPGDFPLALNPGDTWQYEEVFAAAPGEESFGELRGEIVFHPGEGTETLQEEWIHWVSVFPHREAGESAGLSDELRERLIAVTNARPQNGHIFLADHVHYFADYLNIRIPDRLAALLSGEFGLPDQGLPVGEEQYLLFGQGRMTFYGIKVLELIAEEDCNESDDRLDLENLRETNPADVDLST